MLQEHCVNQLPQEGCGILAGSGREITSFFPVKNQEERTNAYSFEARSYLTALKEIRNQAIQWIGIIHSHPNTEPYPSFEDIARWPDPMLTCWILSLKEQPNLAAFSIREGTCLPIPYRVKVI
ncbi:JAB domain-containing protein [Marininema halotolerans]|uniref:JAB domain-containing protein n=1 Tax=Marininema halotolerans TaxID=1155944 RepID=A0A1I6RI55_9BACL|nr:JAB domain-containing protein [Marininema halotolerans]